MQLYLSMKWLPEIRNRSWKERRQALWKAGLKPYRNWRVWLAMAVTGFVALWALDMVLGMMIMDPSVADSNPRFFGLLTLLLLICVPALMVCRSSYLKAMRPYLVRMHFDPFASWWGTAIKGLLLDGLFILLFIAWVAGLDFAINSYDEAPDPRVASVRNWPEPIPDANNGFLYATGLMAAPGTSPFEAGSRWVAGINEAIDKHSRNYPQMPEGLKYVPYAPPASAAKPDADRQGAYAKFCSPGKAACLNIVRQEQKQVEEWLAANQELLARYLALQKYLDWQYAIKAGDASVPLPPLGTLMRTQSLMHASVLLAVEKKQAGKAVAMLDDDIHFVRNMLSSKDSLIGKMVAASMLAGDLAVLAEIIEAHPEELKPYWAKIENMAEPLSAPQVSIANAFRFEERYVTSFLGDDSYSQVVSSDLPPVIDRWTSHHFKRNATTRLMLNFWERVLKSTDVRDAGYTPPSKRLGIEQLPGTSRLTGFLHNQAGKIIALVAVPEYSSYPNKLYDLNALNNLVRLRLLLARDGVTAGGVPAYLLKADKSLSNPETGKPFDWDGAQNQIYFTPASENIKNRYPLDGGKSGRVALTIPAAAARAK